MVDVSGTTDVLLDPATGSTPDMDPVRAAAGLLRDYIGQSSGGDWDYTRNVGSLRRLVYDDPTQRVTTRLRSAARTLTGRFDDFGLGVSRWALARVQLRRPTSLPDGTVGAGRILVLWEEDGEYVQLMQPTVGTLIADWLDDQPDNPHAVRVAQELQAIADRYTTRATAGDVTS